MKKRLLALALCLVMMTSVLPITAAAANVDRIHITGTGFGITSTSPYYHLQNDSCNVTVDGTENAPGFIGYSWYLYHDVQCDKPVWNDLVDGETYYFGYGIYAPDTISFSNLTKENCSLRVNGYSTACVKLEPDSYDPRYRQIIFQVTKDHDWKFTVSENNDTLTAKCQNQECRKEVSVTLKAHSVTLPESPFNATVETTGNFKEVFSYGDIFYRYKDPTNGWIDVDDPKTFAPKPGEYQAGVWVYGLPGNGEVAARATSNDDGTNQGGKELLFVKYTAVDPAVTAQTGDNRPIELMLGSVVVFSALAAAAFIVDSKRKYQQ